MRANFVMAGVATGIRRNLSMTVTLVLSTAIALGFISSALLANTEITKFKNKYENQINVSIYLCPKKSPQPPCTTETTADQVSQIESTLNGDSLVRSWTYISDTQAWELGKQQQPGAAKFLQYGVLPASFSVKLKDIKSDYPSFKNKYQVIPGVGQVNNAIDTINTLLSIIDSVRWGSLIIALVVLFASILLIANTVQMAAAQRKNETSIMRLVGASRWMTELPFILETVIATAAGGLIALFGVWIGKHFVLDGVFRGPTQNGVIPNLSINDVLIAGGIGIIVGIVLSAVTAFGTLRLRVRL